VTFDVAADSYDRFMGRYSRRLSPLLADMAGVRAGQRVLDVGCGPGALTTELVDRLGAGAVAAADPSEPFVAAARRRHPGVEVALAGAEDLPFEDGAFDAALAQLVVSFMGDPVAGLGEMGRVTRAGGIVAACVWDLAGGQAPLSPFWRAVVELDPGARDEASQAGAGEGQLAALFAAAGLHDVEDDALAIRVEHARFEEWWEPFTLGVGPAGSYLAGLEADAANEVRERCRLLLGDGPFTLAMRAWAARGRV
jgi:SAM-dependent methyltransferase